MVEWRARSLVLGLLVGCAAPAATEAEPAAPAAQSTATATQAEPAAQWCIRTVPDQDGNTVFVTINLGYREWRGKSALPYLVHVNVKTTDSNGNGHPTDAEAEVLNRVEDRITMRLLSRVRGKYVGRATTRGFRELMYYVSGAQEAHVALEELAKEPQERPWEYRIGEDRVWANVTPLLAAEPACL